MVRTSPCHHRRCGAADRTQRMRRILVCIAVLATACRADASASTTVPSALAENATMISVVDGDTIDVDIRGHRERVRLIGIDTPETKKPNTPVQCYGPEATKFTKSLLPKDVALHLERDVVARDDFGRMLAYVYLPIDGEFVNLPIIRQGYARPLTIKPNAAHADGCVESANAAQREHICRSARWTG